MDINIVFFVIVQIKSSHASYQMNTQNLACKRRILNMCIYINIHVYIVGII